MEEAPLIFKVMTKYFWLAALIVTAINVLAMRRRGAKLYKDDEEELQRFSEFLWWFGLWLGLPWIVMGVGITVGGVPGVWHYFRPRDGNFWVLAWWVSVLLMWAYTFYWVYLGGGAEKLAKYEVVWYHGLGKRGPVKSTLKIKLAVGAMLAGGIIAGIVMWMKDIPLPDFLD